MYGIKIILSGGKELGEGGGGGEAKTSDMMWVKVFGTGSPPLGSFVVGRVPRKLLRDRPPPHRPRGGFNSHGGGGGGGGFPILPGQCHGRKFRSGSAVIRLMR